MDEVRWLRIKPVDLNPFMKIYNKGVTKSPKFQLVCDKEMMRGCQVPGSHSATSEPEDSAKEHEVCGN